MAVVMRGWSRTASTAVKLATAERIIGYPFKNVHLLYEALDQSRLVVPLPKGKRTRLRQRNTRLALVGDAHARLYMTQRWYNKQDLTGIDWSKIATATLSNGNLGHFGFKLGLHECAIPNKIDSHYDMATTVEAMFAAVQMDGADLEQFHKVMARFGLQHKLVEPVQRAWIYHAVKSQLSLSDRFFIGHHFKLQEGVFETQMKPSTAQEETTLSRGRANSLWRRIKKSWTGIKLMWLGPRGNHGKPEWILPAERQKPLLESATRSPNIVKPLVEEPPPTVTETTIAASKDVATSETNILGKESLGRSEGDGRAAVPEEATNREDPAEKQEATAESSSPEVNPSRSSKPQTQPFVPNGDTSADETRTTASNSRDSNKASTGAPSPNPPGKDHNAIGAELDAERQPHEAPEVDPLELMEAGDSREKLIQMLQKLGKRDKELGAEQRQMELAFRDFKLAGKRRTPEQAQELANLKLNRNRITRRLHMLRGKLKRLRREVGGQEELA